MKYLILGSKGQLGNEFVKKFEKEEFDYKSVDIEDVDISKINSVHSAFDSIRPDIVINCAAYNQVDFAEKEYFQAFKTNALGVRNISNASRKHNALLVHYSTDYVFDGTKDKGLYKEDDATNPINEYGKSKLAGELLLKEVLDDYLILRLSWVFGEGSQNFIYKIHEWAKNYDSLKIADDEISVPTSTKTIVEITLAALNNGLKGLFHLTNTGYSTRFEWAKFIIKTLKLNNFVYPVSKEIFDLPAKRPQFSAMSNKKISNVLNTEIPYWEDAVRNFLSTDKLYKSYFS